LSKPSSLFEAADGVSWSGEEIMKEAIWLQLGATWGFLAVAIGAFGAHGLKERLESLGQTANFQTASHYQMYCALALLAVGLLAIHGRSSTALTVAGWSFLLGSLIFSGSLYILAATGLKWLGAITPLGGLLILAGWAALLVVAGQAPVSAPSK
jgi:uncharacterized membrane protein YgdD (TMEM256/DUF423 family)